MRHTKEPWTTNGHEIGDFPMMLVKIANRISGSNYDESVANAERIVKCVNACAGINDPAEFVDLAKRYENDCVRWEKTMMLAIGEDGPGSVVEAIQKLKSEKKILADALELLVHLHACEQEGIGSGQPTSDTWYKAVNEANKAIQSVTN